MRTITRVHALWLVLILLFVGLPGCTPTVGEVVEVEVAASELATEETETLPPPQVVKLEASEEPPATLTAVPTITAAPTATATYTPTVTPTNTPLPPTATATPTSTPTATPTNTPPPPPTDTPKPPPTKTPVPPTATSVPATATPTPTATVHSVGGSGTYLGCPVLQQGQWMTSPPSGGQSMDLARWALGPYMTNVATILNDSNGVTIVTTTGESIALSSITTLQVARLETARAVETWEDAIEFVSVGPEAFLELYPGLPIMAGTDTSLFTQGTIVRFAVACPPYP